MSRKKYWHPIPNRVHWYQQLSNGISSSCASFHIVLLRCCLSRPNLRPNFVKLIEQGAYGLKNSQISPSWAIYRVEHMVNVLKQIHLRRVPSGEVSLVEDRIT